MPNAGDDGGYETGLPEGRFRVAVTWPQDAADPLEVEVRAGQASEVSFRLR